jgi:hypothetical protein
LSQSSNEIGHFAEGEFEDCVKKEVSFDLEYERTN